jgi:hypothetical protein
MEKNEKGCMPAVGTPEDEPLFFSHPEWLVNEAGYDLIAGILPQQQTREEILASGPGEPADAGNPSAQTSQRKGIRGKGCLVSLLILLTGSALLLLLKRSFAGK